MNNLMPLSNRSCKLVCSWKLRIQFGQHIQLYYLSHTFIYFFVHCQQGYAVDQVMCTRKLKSAAETKCSSLVF